MSVFSFESEEEVDVIDVGDHPQRVHTGEDRSSWYQAHVEG